MGIDVVSRKPESIWHGMFNLFGLAGVEKHVDSRPAGQHQHEHRCADRLLAVVVEP